MAKSKRLFRGDKYTSLRAPLQRAPPGLTPSPYDAHGNPTANSFQLHFPPHAGSSAGPLRDPHPALLVRVRTAGCPEARPPHLQAAAHPQLSACAQRPNRSHRRRARGSLPPPKSPQTRACAEHPNRIPHFPPGFRARAAPTALSPDPRPLSPAHPANGARARAAEPSSVAPRR